MPVPAGPTRVDRPLSPAEAGDGVDGGALLANASPTCCSLRFSCFAFTLGNLGKQFAQKDPLSDVGGGPKAPDSGATAFVGRPATVIPRTEPGAGTRRES